MSNWFRMIRVVVPLVAGCALLASLISAVYYLDFVRDAKSVTATIIGSETRTDEDGNVLYQPTFTFVVDGRSYSVTPNSYVGRSPGDVGEQVPVLYDPSNPLNASIDAFVYIWQLPTVTFLLALIFGAAHFAMEWSRRRFRYIPHSGGKQ